MNIFLTATVIAVLFMITLVRKREVGLVRI